MGLGLGLVVRGDGREREEVAEGDVILMMSGYVIVCPSKSKV